ncbi:MAG TPA: hypothetical protein VFE58_02895 [Tepidisphaeraceae bacterium]|jgi:hypothetical protein|nr:hypothetical protein [Tepidisphaeraceae bacterium]
MIIQPAFDPRIRVLGKDLAVQTTANCHGSWRLSRSPALHYAFPNSFRDWLGLESLLSDG